MVLPLTGVEQDSQFGEFEHAMQEHHHDVTPLGIAPLEKP